MQRRAFIKYLKRELQEASAHCDVAMRYVTGVDLLQAEIGAVLAIEFACRQAREDVLQLVAYLQSEMLRQHRLGSIQASTRICKVSPTESRVDLLVSSTCTGM